MRENQIPSEAVLPVATSCSCKNGLGVRSGSGLRHKETFNVLACGRRLWWAPGHLSSPVHIAVSTAN